jgi:dihydroorotate dehydrogenase electron transfer subunit
MPCGATRWHTSVPHVVRASRDEAGGDRPTAGPGDSIVRAAERAGREGLPDGGPTAATANKAAARRVRPRGPGSGPARHRRGESPGAESFARASMSTTQRDPAPAACSTGFADAADYLTARVVFNRRIAEGTFRLRLECPKLAAAAIPGQFAMLRLPDRHDPLLARPLAFYDTFRTAADKVPHGLPAERRYADFVYLVHGKFTTALQHTGAGDEIVVWGPLGNGFTAVPAVDHLVLVAGGIGQTALLALGRERLGHAVYGVAGAHRTARRVTLCWGARSATTFGDVDDFRAAGIDVHQATLDGSMGRRGTVVDLLDALLAAGDLQASPGSLHVACCGPDAMMAAVSRWTASRGIGCHASLEAPMACGIGICFTCVARIRDGQDGAWDYRRTCIEGPVFDATRIVWET